MTVCGLMLLNFFKDLLRGHLKHAGTLNGLTGLGMLTHNSQGLGAIY